MHDRLHDLEIDVRDLKPLPAAEIRARGRTRSRRQKAAVAAAAAAVVAATAGITLGWPRQQLPAPVADRPTTPGLTCDLSLPSNPADVQVRVVDGGAASTRLATAAAQLRARTFTVLDGTTGPRPTTPATLVYGPASIGSAAVLRAMVYGATTLQFDPNRPGETIDLILGPSFTRLATTTEMNQNLATAGEPTAPPECAGR
ncbi:LytR C-terminal domain-containing protein [Paractinoplanes atraurantiacus]|uniref:LytR C-terminal domain-containing protein n=1 Tax=Paractinoplanes atraurantiacus TaxID=1036182 RepID=UPI00117801D2|nr:LytR C-terminal domain-containing protein [Actinoplanes atraurantiacus]